MARVLKYDGILPNPMTPEGDHRPLTPDDAREIRDFIAAHRTETTPFDIVVEGATPGDDSVAAAAIVRGWADAGATWWIEALWNADSAEAVWARVRQGPPRIDNNGRA
jgi:hypothetical protein